MGIRLECHHNVCEDYLTGSFPIWKDGLEKLSLYLQLKAEMHFSTDPIPEEILTQDEESVEDHADDQQQSDPLNTVIWEEPIIR